MKKALVLFFYLIFVSLFSFAKKDSTKKSQDCFEKYDQQITCKPNLGLSELVNPYAFTYKRQFKDQSLDDNKANACSRTNEFVDNVKRLDSTHKESENLINFINVDEVFTDGKKYYYPTAIVIGNYIIAKELQTNTYIAFRCPKKADGYKKIEQIISKLRGLENSKKINTASNDCEAIVKGNAKTDTKSFNTSVNRQLGFNILGTFPTNPGEPFRVSFQNDGDIPLSTVSINLGTTNQKDNISIFKTFRLDSSNEPRDSAEAPLQKKAICNSNDFSTTTTQQSNKTPAKKSNLSR